MSSARKFKEITTPLDLAHSKALKLADETLPGAKKSIGQYFTCPHVAAFMASQVSLKRENVRILDPGSGTGVLSSALVETLCAVKPFPKDIHVTAYEIDPAAARCTEAVLLELKTTLRKKRISFTYDIRERDFVLDRVQLTIDPKGGFDIVIMNPPYFKIGKADSRALALPEICYGQPNIYALFMALGLELLKPHGQMISITPRSFMSGQYFRAFRKFAFSKAIPDRLHVFTSRDKAFRQDEVLQENVIIRWQQSNKPNFKKPIAITASTDIHDARGATATLLPLDDLIDATSHSMLFHLPSNERELVSIKKFRQYSENLKSIGASVSTGKVVAFRADNWLQSNRQRNPAAVPLVWMNHISRRGVHWPLPTFHKPQRILAIEETAQLLIPKGNYILVRRVSSKNDKFRIIAATFLASDFDTELIGIENHVNVIQLPNTKDEVERLMRLTSYLNSEMVDDYIRALSGNTQVGAADLSGLPIPPKLFQEKIPSYK